MALSIPNHRLVEAATTLARNEVVTPLGEGLVRVNTKPNESLYPFQWNWDSAIVAGGFADLGGARRGLAELQSLHSAQHSSGLQSHIAYGDDPTDLANYFPGPGMWGNLSGIDGRRISGITQPALSGIALKRIVDAGIDPASADVRQLVQRIHAHHDWWMRERDPLGDGNVVVLNGWSTGRDNAPEVLRLYDQPGTPRFAGVGKLRQDLKHGVPADSRPSDRYYEQAMGTTLEAASHGGWLAPGLAGKMHFQLTDPLVGAMLGASAHDLGSVARAAGLDRIADESDVIAARLRAAQASRTTSDGTVFALDARRGELMTKDLTIGAAMAPWMPGATDQQVRRAAELVSDGGELAGSHGGVLTTARASSYFDSPRYWQGPSWPHMDELVATGLLRSANEPGRAPEVADLARDAAAQVDARAATTYARAGAAEYFDADTGAIAGKVGMSFSNSAMLSFARRHGHDLDPALDAYRAASTWRPDMRTELAH